MAFERIRVIPEQIAAALAEPFDPRELKWKPQTVKGDRCLPVVYIDARCVMERLDQVVGSENWQDEYAEIGDGSIRCTLRVCFGNDRWISKSDVGSRSEQPDEGDRMKSAFSDALKRTAVKFGIGRYLYKFPHTWVDFDKEKKQIKKPPAVPDFARPRSHTLFPELETKVAGLLLETESDVFGLLRACGVISGVNAEQFESMIQKLNVKRASRATGGKADRVRVPVDAA